MNRQRHLGLLVIFAVVAATPAFRKTAGPAFVPAAIPDFSGIWAHPFYPGFELPLSGPGPVTNRSRRTQIFDVDGRPRLPGTKPLLVEHQQVGDYTNPILKSDARKS
jgi:hypothetical protein